MTSICEKCGGFLIGEQVLDYYQTRRLKCVNCGWYRNDSHNCFARFVGMTHQDVRN